MQIALKNVWAQRSLRIEIRRQSFGLANIFSTLWRCRYKVLQHVAGKPALGSRWNAGRDAASGENLSECITIMALVGNNRLGVWQHWIDQSRVLMVTHLSFCEKKDNWPATQPIILAKEEPHVDHHHYRL
jgi:hypothetical protein